MSCLRDQSRPPNETNLGAHYDVPDDGLWNLWEDHWRSHADSGIHNLDPLIHPKAAPVTEDLALVTTAPKRELIENPPASVSALPDLLAPKPPPPASITLQPNPVSRLIYKMRWANLGRSYHWGSKSYDFSKKLAPFPKDIREYCLRAVRTVQWEDIWGDEDENVPPEEWGEEGVNWQSWHGDYGMCAETRVKLSLISIFRSYTQP